MKHVDKQRIAIRTLAALSLGIGTFAGTVAPAAAGPEHHTVVPSDKIQWGPGPASLPQGAQAAALLGSPAQAGPFVLRLKFPAGYVVPPHRHSKDEFVTVISGAFAVSSGEKVDRALQPLPPASFVHLPAGMPHFAWTEVETVVQINGMGPFDVVYVDPANDPRRQ